MLNYTSSGRRKRQTNIVEELETKYIINYITNSKKSKAGIAQLGERQTEDLKVACSIHAHRTIFIYIYRLNVSRLCIQSLIRRSDK